MSIENAKCSFHLAQIMYGYCRPKINNKIKFGLSWTPAQISIYNLMYKIRAGSKLWLKNVKLSNAATGSWISGAACK